jgi:hypothetical protein
VLDEDEEGVLHLPRRELDAADNLLQRKRAVKQEAVDHLLRGRDRALGHGTRAARKRKEWRERRERTAYRYEGAEVVRDNAYGEEDAVLRHHGRSAAERRRC